ncbi:MAG: VCBS repeat-containing protein [Phycisphaerales bacterium]|nr:MAG: VCBS repeat-containing protein [Phycisphaerales bacterium]
MRKTGLLIVLVCFLPLLACGVALADNTLLNLGPGVSVRSAGADIIVSGYSVPSFVDWNNDGLRDLVVGEGGGIYPGKVRVYLNADAEHGPQFSAWFYAQSDGSDLSCEASGCMGCFPRVVYWDADTRKDLLVGESSGGIRLFLNIGTDEDPTFDAGAPLQVGPPGSKVNINVGYRATPTVVDWNNDGKKDLVVGAVDGLIRVFINEGTEASPEFLAQTFAQANGSNLDIGSRSSPDVLDLDGDGKKDLLTGNTAGELLFYKNLGADDAPAFSGYSLVESDGVPIDLAGTPRSRPFVCYWTDDAYLDVLIGAGDGKVHLYQGTPTTGDINADGRVDFLDLALLADYWRQGNCGLCGGADLFDDDTVDIRDLAEMAANWLVLAQSE